MLLIDKSHDSEVDINRVYSLCQTVGFVAQRSNLRLTLNGFFMLLEELLLTMVL